mmetsp:Transcript_9785/g.19924  ORF Transcript_9785/g.19924 Transcript_9785/m.19924 type:complete len:126 (+) Transcript_9785:49-426(+)
MNLCLVSMGDTGSFRTTPLSWSTEGFARLPMSSFVATLGVFGPRRTNVAKCQASSWRMSAAIKPQRLIVLSDGSWQTPENETPTNILKLARAIRPCSESDGMHQIVFYDGAEASKVGLGRWAHHG